VSVLFLLQDVPAAKAHTSNVSIHPRYRRIALLFPAGSASIYSRLTHIHYPGAVTISGNSGDDAKAYQEKQVRRAIEEVRK